MKKISFSAMAMMAIIATSCSSDEPMANLAGASNQIGFTVTADGGSRSTSAFLNGTDISKMTVSAWVKAPGNGKYPLPAYGESNTNNASFFLNDVLVRTSGGTFNYETDARYWPQNKERLDFFAVVDNPAANPFSFSAQDGHPGLEGTFKQGGIDDMPDMLFATAFNETWNENRVGQQNVSFHFDHAFAKVVVTAQVKNSNLRVHITDMSICGVLDEASFTMPYISGAGADEVFNNAFWTGTTYEHVDAAGHKSSSVNYTDIHNLLKNFSESKPAILDTRIAAKVTLLGQDAPNDLLVLPYAYNGRNGSGKIQTYIELTGYAYNIAGSEFDEDTDVLVYGKLDADGNLQPAKMRIPIEFDWKMGTINRYNIVFDCGNGGSTSDDPNDPAFVRIGYEVEVNPWTEGQNKPGIEYPDHIKD